MDNEKKPDSSASTHTSHTSRMSVPVYAPLCPPRIENISHESLVKWKRARAEYEATVKVRCASTGEDPERVVVSVKNTMDLQLLNICCKLKWKTAVDQLDDTQLKKELDLFDSRLMMNLRESDANARVIDYFKLCEDIIKENGLTTIFEGDQGMKKKCKILVRQVEPVELREAIKSHQRFQDHVSKSDEVKLFDLVMDKALKQNELFRQSRRAGTKKRPYGRNAPSEAKKTKIEQSASGKDGQECRVEQVTETSGQRGSAQAVAVPVSGCLHCGKQHLVLDCPGLNSEEKVRLLKEHAAKLRESRRKQGVGAKRVNLVSSGAGSNPPAMACLNDVVMIQYCADSGSDMNIISKAHLELAKAKDKGVHEFALDRPVVTKTVGGCLESKMDVDLFVTLHTAAGPARCQERKRCMVIESEENEFIVGKAILMGLGIDVDRTLEILAAHEADSDDDPIPEVEHTELYVAVDAVEAVNTVIDEAVRRGLLPEKSKAKARVAFLAHDVWRLALGDDPPAAVE